MTSSSDPDSSHTLYGGSEQSSSQGTLPPHHATRPVSSSQFSQYFGSRAGNRNPRPASVASSSSRRDLHMDPPDPSSESSSFHNARVTNYQPTLTSGSQESFALPPLGARPGTSTSRMTATSTVSGRKSRASRTTSYLGIPDSNIICAVSEARGIPPSVGIVFLNVSNGEVILSQICDNQSFVKTMHNIRVNQPSRILIVASACPPNPKSTLYRVIEEDLPEMTIIPLARKLWSTTQGLEDIDSFASHEEAHAVRVAVKDNFYVTCSLAAV